MRVSCLGAFLGLFVAREFARYRLRREPFIGTSRASVAARLQRGAPGMGGGGPVERRIPADAFYWAQQHQHAADVHFGIAGAAVRGPGRCACESERAAWA